MVDIHNGRKNYRKKKKVKILIWLRHKLVKVQSAFRVDARRRVVAAAQARTKINLKLMTILIGKKDGKMIVTTLIWRDKEQESEL